MSGGQREQRRGQRGGMREGRKHRETRQACAEDEPRGAGNWGKGGEWREDTMRRGGSGTRCLAVEKAWPHADLLFLGPICLLPTLLWRQSGASVRLRLRRKPTRIPPLFPSPGAESFSFIHSGFPGSGGNPFADSRGGLLRKDQGV